MKSWAGAVVAVAGAALTVYLLYVLRHALLIVYVGVLLAVLFAPAVDAIGRLRIGRWHPSRGLSVVLLAALVAGAVLAFMALALPPILSDVSGFRQQWPIREQQLNHELQRLPFGRAISLDAIQDALARQFGGRFQLLRIGSDVVSILETLLLAVYFLVDGPRAFSWLVSLFPPSRQARAAATLRHAASEAQRWLSGQGLMMLTHGASAMITFGLLGLKYFVTLGIFAALVNVIPVLGPIVTVVVAGVVAAISSIEKLIGVVVFYVIYHNVEGAFLQPRIMEARVHIPAVAVIVALVIGDELAGVVGILVSVPTAVMLNVLVREYVVHRRAPAARPA